MKKRKIDIFDMLPEEANRKIDELGYSFLSAQGFNADGAIESEPKQIEIGRELKRQGKELRYVGMVDKTKGAILVWFELYQGKKKIAVSQGIKFMPKSAEGGNGGK